MYWDFILARECSSLHMGHLCLGQGMEFFSSQGSKLALEKHFLGFLPFLAKKDFFLYTNVLLISLD